MPTSAQSETKNGATLTRISLAVPLGGDRERLGDGMAERVGHGARHRRAGRRGHAGVHDPELDPVALAVEADQVRADRGAAVEAELADALGDLGDEQVVAVELPRGEREIDAVVLEVDGEDAGADLAALGHLAERAAGAVGPLGRGRSESGDGGDEQQGGGAGELHGDSGPRVVRRGGSADARGARWGPRLESVGKRRWGLGFCGIVACQKAGPGGKKREARVKTTCSVRHPERSEGPCPQSRPRPSTRHG